VAIGFDGSHIWVAGYQSNAVTELDMAGILVRTFGAGSLPLGFAFDGTHIWVLNNGSNNATRL
jgi:DNA-binding beta-propeller fold protein YncE